MASSTQPRLRRPIFWLIVAIAASLALILPLAWIAYSDQETHTANDFNFHPLLVVLYAPIAFGILWPALLRVAVWKRAKSGEAQVWPAKTALIMFAVSCGLSIPLVAWEYRFYVRGLEALRADSFRMSQQRAQEETEKQNALAALQANGVTSFIEPLTGQQEYAVNRYLDAHSGSPTELENASRHYATSLGVMDHLAERRYCPPQVLEILFENVIAVQSRSPHQAGLYEVLYQIEWNPNTPVRVLEKMLENRDLTVRKAAASNPRLPKEAKISYLKKASTSQFSLERIEAANDRECPSANLALLLEDEDPNVRGAAARNPGTPTAAKIEYLRRAAVSSSFFSFFERAWAAQNPDCPVEVLTQLASDPAMSQYVASNPNLPMDLLQTLVKSSNSETRNRAIANVEKREKGER